MDHLDWTWVMKKYNSMGDFCEDDKSFNFGEWRRWYAACLEAEKRLDPKAFKKKRECLDSS